MDVLDDFDGKIYNKPRTVKAGRIMALISFILGSTIFISYFVSGKKEYFAVLGFYFLLFAIAVNGLFFLGVLIEAITKPAHRKELIKTSGIMLLNIPISALYFFIVINVI